MWYPTRSERGVARFQQVPLVTDFDQILALNDVEPFILIAMEMPRGAAFGMVHYLDHQKCPVAVRRGYFEQQGADANVAMQCVSVAVAGNLEGTNGCGCH